MKTANMKKSLLMIFLLIFVPSIHASAGGAVVGNGGDICEDRFNIIRDDINLWIEKGGSKGLRLPKSISLNQYNSTMLNVISKAQISCSDDKVFVGTTEKTCKNFLNSTGVFQIKCNNGRFMTMDSESQYKLVHHEYAGLSGFEVNNGAASDYTLSNQIAEYLIDKVEQRLGIKDAKNGNVTPIAPMYAKTFDCKLVAYDNKDGFRMEGFTVAVQADQMGLKNDLPALIDIDTDEGVIESATYSGSAMTKPGDTGVLIENGDGRLIPYQLKYNRDGTITATNVIDDDEAIYSCKLWDSKTSRRVKK